MGGQRRGQAVERKKFTTAIDMAKELPHLFKPISDSPALIGEEQDSLAQCEAAVETLKGAFWAAGKALQIIRDARLYRGSHKTFDEYCDDRWSMNRQYADKLIRAWPIAEALYAKQSAPSLTPIGVKKLNQAQVWELVPVAEAWDVDTATFVYDTVVEIDGQAVTAAVLKGAVKALPKGNDFDREAAAERILEYVSSLSEPPPEKKAAPVVPIEQQIAVRVDKAIEVDWVRRLAAQDRSRASAYLDQVQQRLDHLRQELLASTS